MMENEVKNMLRSHGKLVSKEPAKEPACLGRCLVTHGQPQLVLQRLQATFLLIRS